MKKRFVLLLLLIFGIVTAGASQPAKPNIDSIKKAAAEKLAQLRANNQLPANTGLPSNNGLTTNIIAQICKPVNKGEWPTVGYILMVGIVIAFVWFAKKSNVLRDDITDEVLFMKEAQKSPKYKGKALHEIPRPYSLAKSQLGIWTVIIGCSYIYTALCGPYAIELIPVDKNLLFLMGISAGTTAIGNVIDVSNKEVPHHQNGPSEGVFSDILSDQAGISIHRFQNVIWTLIAVTIYISQLNDLGCRQLPTLDSTLIALTGISSMTYLGLKVNENKPPQPPVAPPVKPS